jgi:hypothetical protein
VSGFVLRAVYVFGEFLPPHPSRGWKGGDMSTTLEMMELAKELRILASMTPDPKTKAYAQALRALSSALFAAASGDVVERDARFYRATAIVTENDL